MTDDYVEIAPISKKTMFSAHPRKAIVDPEPQDEDYDVEADTDDLEDAVEPQKTVKEPVRDEYSMFYITLGLICVVVLLVVIIIFMVYRGSEKKEDLTYVLQNEKIRRLNPRIKPEPDVEREPAPSTEPVPPKKPVEDCKVEELDSKAIMDDIDRIISITDVKPNNAEETKDADSTTFEHQKMVLESGSV